MLAQSKASETTQRDLDGPERLDLRFPFGTHPDEDANICQELFSAEMHSLRPHRVVCMLVELTCATVGDKTLLARSRKCYGNFPRCSNNFPGRFPAVFWTFPGNLPIFYWHTCLHLP